MVFNPKKCEFLQVSNKKKLCISYNYGIADSPIKEGNHIKYLGVIIDQSLTWNEHIKQISNKPSKLLPFFIATSITVHLLLNMTGFAKRGLVRTQFQVSLFTAIQQI